jgi:hypothetical protein
LSGWFCYSVLQKSSGSPSSLVASIDTVFVTKEIAAEPVKIYDTVYIERESRAARSAKAAGFIPAYTSVAYDSFPATEELNVLSLDELENIPNVSKGNSMRDDSLYHKYSIITL